MGTYTIDELKDAERNLVGNLRAARTLALKAKLRNDANEEARWLADAAKDQSALDACRVLIAEHALEVAA